MRVIYFKVSIPSKQLCMLNITSGIVAVELLYLFSFNWGDDPDLEGHSL